MSDTGNSSDECTWYGVACDETEMVKSIEISDGDLWGKIPAEVSLLANIGKFVIGLITI